MIVKPLFQVGDLVRVQSNGSLGPAEEALDAFSKTSTLGHRSGIYEVVRTLPEVDGRQQYRIRGGVPPQERVAMERQLIKASQQHAMSERYRPTG